MQTLLAQATDVVNGLSVAASSAGYGNSAPSVETILAQTINVVLSASGIILLGFLIYAGFLYMTAGGDNDKVKKAKRLITNTIIGIVIIVGAYAISVFVIGQVAQVIGQPIESTTGG